MKIIYTNCLCCVLGIAVSSMFFLPAYLRVKSERDDARLSLEAYGPALIVKSPEDTLPAEGKSLRDSASEVVSVSDMPEQKEIVADEMRRDTRRRDRRRPDLQNMTQEEREAFHVEMQKRMEEMDQRRREFAQRRLDEFVEKTALDETQAAYLGTVIASLNSAAGEIVSEWAGYIKDTGTFDADYRIRFLYDLSSAIVDAYDDIDDGLPENWRAKSGGDLNLANLIDPEILRPLSDAQREAGIHAPPVEMMLGGFGGRGPKHGHDRTVGGE